MLVQMMFEEETKDEIDPKVAIMSQNSLYSQIFFTNVDYGIKNKQKITKRYKSGLSHQPFILFFDGFPPSVQDFNMYL